MSGPQVLVDTNVLLDVITEDPAHGGASEIALLAALDLGAAINPVIYAEVSIGYESIEEVDDALHDDLVHLPLPYEAGFLAGKAFARYRRRGGTRVAPLPDFLIGAHAAVAGLALLTRDRRSYEHDFPTVRVIRP